MKRLAGLSFVAMAAGLSACASLPARAPAAAPTGPVVETPPTPPQTFAAAETPQGPYADADWIDGLGASELPPLVAEALRANADLAASAARLDAARARLAQARAGRLPTVDVGATSSATRSDPGPGGAKTTESFGLSADVSWEVDLWGRIRARTEGAEASVAASRADLEAARLSIAGRTVLSWIDLAEARELAALASRDVAQSRQSEDVVERRYVRGLVDSLDLRLARAQTANGGASAERTARAVGDSARTLEVILARYPAAGLTAGTVPDPGPLAAIGAPADLLARRPDVAASEARLAAAGFNVAEARAALRPRLTLSGSLNSGGGDLGDILDPETLVARLVGGLAAPVFRGGALKAEVDAAQAQAREAAASHVAVVLNAWKEAEDALAADAEAARRQTFLAEALAQSAKAEERTRRRYAEGLATIFDLLNAQSRRFDAERQSLSARADRARARVRLHLALGGAAALPSTSPAAPGTP